MLLSNSTSPYFGTAQQNTRVQNVRYDRFVKQRSGGYCGRCLLIQVWLLSSCLQFQLMKRKRTWRNKEKTPWGNEVDGLAQVFTMLSKRVVGASKRIVDSKQKNRRCSAKESSVLLKEATMLKGSSQYTLRHHLTAMPGEVVITWLWLILLHRLFVSLLFYFTYSGMFS